MGPGQPPSTWKVPRSNVVHATPNGITTYCGKLLKADTYSQPFAQDMERAEGPITCKKCLRSSP